MLLFERLPCVTQRRLEIFKSATSDDSNGSLQTRPAEPEPEDNAFDSIDEDGLPPLEANTNRRKPP